MNLKRYRPGEVLFPEGASGTSAYIMKSGKVEVTKQIGNKEIRLATFGAGEIFGEMALLGAEARTATVKSIERTEVLNISRARLLAMFKTCDPILKHLTLTLINRLKRTNGLIKPVKAENICRSVCRLIMLIASQSGVTPESNGSISISHEDTIQQVVGILAVDAANCQLILDRLEMMNIIEISSKGKSAKDTKIVLLDPESFLSKVDRVADEIEEKLQNRIVQRPVYVDLYEMAEELGVERELLLKKIGEAQVPKELFFFHLDDATQWFKHAGPAFFTETKKKLTAEDIEEFGDLVHLKNAILKPVFADLSVYNAMQLAKYAESEPDLQKKVMACLPAKTKRTVNESIGDLEEVDEDEIEETIEGIIEAVKEIMEEAERKKQGGGKE